MTEKLARLVERIEGPRAWTGLDTGDAQPWLVALPSSWAELLDGAIESWRRDRCSITDIRLDEGLRCSGREAFGKVLSKLEAGRGFVVLDRLPLDRQFERIFDDNSGRPLFGRNGQTAQIPPRSFT